MADLSDEINYVRSGDLWIAYQVSGEGPVDLVLVQGWITNLEAPSEELPSVHDAIQRLGSFARFIRLDKRGTGLSDRGSAHTTYEDVMEDVRAVLDAVGSERAALFGTAEGGPVCCLLAATYPERTSALILYGSFARRAWAEDYPWGLPEPVQQRLVDTYESDWGRRPIGMRSSAPSHADDPRFARAYLRAQRLGVSPSEAVAWAKWTLQTDVRQVLPTIRVPTLVLHRAGDRGVDIANGRYLAEHIPGARFVELPGVDHYWFLAGDALLDEVEEFLTGSRRPLEADRVLATVLFTDIVGSTERAAALGDRRWRESLDAHDRAVRVEIERHRGYEVKTTGDGFLATFDGPARAIRCAHAIVDAAKRQGLEVRAGLHTGECERRGADVGGIAVHIGARVAALAGPGEVLVSSTVKDLVIGSGLSFEDRGARSLKGVPGEWRLYLVRP